MQPHNTGKNKTAVVHKPDNLWRNERNLPTTMIERTSRGFESFWVLPVLEAVLLVVVRCCASVRLANESKAAEIDKNELEWMCIFLIGNVVMCLPVRRDEKDATEMNGSKKRPEARM
jgi:hypothetical protein